MESTHLLAYLAKGIYEDNQVYRCGALVVTLTGVPKEFRCTSPVKPNQIQKITYGKSLEPHIYVEVMGKPLIKELREKVAVYLVEDPVLLSIGDCTDVPIVYIRQQGVPSKIDKKILMQSSLISNSLGDFDSIIVESKTSDEVKLAHGILEEASKHLNLLEPFNRLLLAMEKIHESKQLDG